MVLLISLQYIPSSKGTSRDVPRDDLFERPTGRPGTHGFGTMAGRPAGVPEGTIWNYIITYTVLLLPYYYYYYLIITIITNLLLLLFSYYQTLSRWQNWLKKVNFVIRAVFNKKTSAYVSGKKQNKRISGTKHKNVKIDTR